MTHLSLGLYEERLQIIVFDKSYYTDIFNISFYQEIHSCFSIIPKIYQLHCRVSDRLVSPGIKIVSDVQLMT